MIYIEKRNDSMERNLAKYQAFLKTVESGSFTKAAEELHYAQSSVSKMIADLEKEWKVTLLQRSRQGICLTSTGEQLLPYVRTLVNESQKLTDYIAQLHGVQSGIVRIGTFSSVAINWMPDVFARFQKDYPGIDYELLLGDYDEVEQWIMEGRVDCGFLRLPTVEQFETIPLKYDEYKVVLPKAHPLCKKKRIKIQELEKEPFLLLEHGGKTEVSKLLEQYEVHPDIRFTTWEDFAIMAMVEKGLGIAILPELILQRIPYEVEIRPLVKPYFRSIGIAMKSREQLSSATQMFLQYLIQYV